MSEKLVWFESKDLVLIAGQTHAIVFGREKPVKGLVQNGWAAHPYSLDVFGAKLTDLLPDPVVVPSFRVDILLGEPQVQMEDAWASPFAVGIEGLEKLKGDRLLTVRERHIEVELEVSSIDIFCKIRINTTSVFQIARLGWIRINRTIWIFKSDILSDHRSDQVNEAENTSARSKCHVVTSYFLA